MTSSALLCTQIETGSIVGTVRDKSGAVVPGVEVSVRRVATNESFVALTSEAGDYRVERLPVGQYELRVSLSGFKTEVRKNIQLQIRQTIRVDFEMAVGHHCLLRSIGIAPFDGPHDFLMLGANDHGSLLSLEILRAGDFVEDVGENPDHLLIARDLGDLEMEPAIQLAAASEGLSVGCREGDRASECLEFLKLRTRDRFGGDPRAQLPSRIRRS